MVTLQLSDTEAHLLARLLTMASYEFSNHVCHGCNDFDIRSELKLNAQDAQKVALELRASMQETGCDENPDSPSPYFMDWLLMAHFRVRVEALLRRE